MPSIVNSKPECAYNESEPADPDKIDHSVRETLRLGTMSRCDNLPKPLWECGCGNCLPVVDSLASTNTGIEQECKAFDICDSPRPVTVKKAEEIYTKYVIANYSRDKTSKYERNRQRTYPRILSVDRSFSEKYNLTTAMITRRVSPVDKGGGFFRPLELNYWLLRDTVQQKVLKRLRYYLDRFEWSYTRVVAGTKSAATPHEHIYLWINDPKNAVDHKMLAPAIDAHVKFCPIAERKHHQHGSNVDDGAIEIRHTPPLATDAAQKRDTTDRACTRGAMYLATQLPHMAVGNLLAGSGRNPQSTLLQAGAISWASPYNWFGMSNNAPSLGEL